MTAKHAQEKVTRFVLVEEAALMMKLRRQLLWSPQLLQWPKETDPAVATRPTSLEVMMKAEAPAWRACAQLAPKSRMDIVALVQQGPSPQQEGFASFAFQGPSRCLEAATARGVHQARSPKHPGLQAVMHVRQAHMRLIINCATSALQASFQQQVRAHAPNVAPACMHQKQAVSFVSPAKLALMQVKPVGNAVRALQVRCPVQLKVLAAFVRRAVLPEPPSHVTSVLLEAGPAQEPLNAEAVFQERFR